MSSTIKLLRHSNFDMQPVEVNYTKPFLCEHNRNLVSVCLASKTIYETTHTMTDEWITKPSTTYSFPSGHVRQKTVPVDTGCSDTIISSRNTD